MHSHHTDEGAPSVSAPEPGDVESARALIAEEEQRRMQACAAELQQVLAKYGMRMDVTEPQIVLAPTP